MKKYQDNIITVITLLLLTTAGTLFLHEVRQPASKLNHASSHIQAISPKLDWGAGVMTKKSVNSNRNRVKARQPKKTGQMLYNAGGLAFR